MKNVAGHVTAWSFLMLLVAMTATQNVMSATLRDGLNQNQGAKYTLQPYEVFNRAAVGGEGGIFEFLNEQTDRATGVCNVDKAKLPSNQFFIFNRVAINYTKGAENKLTTVDYLSKITPEIRNAEFVITQGGREVLNLPVAALHNASTGANASDQYTSLGSFFYLSDEEEFDWSFKFPKGVSVPADTAAATNYLEVRLSGWRTIKK